MAAVTRTAILFILSVFCMGATASSLSLQWTNTDAQSPAPTFPVERGPDGITWTQIAETTSGVVTYTDTALASSTTYYYRVRAHNSAGFSGYSNIAFGTTLTQAVSGPVAAYGFSEGSGTTTADASGNNYTGTLAGAVTWAASGKYGAALNFSGTANVQVPAIALNNVVPFTYCAWVNPRSQGGLNDGRILHKGTNSTRKILQIDSGTLNSLALYVDRITIAAHAISTANALVLNQWQYVCGAYSETDGPRLYIDAVEIPYGTRTVGSGVTSDDSGDKLYVGNRSTLDKGWDGFIDEVRIYNRVLSLSEMQADMNAAVGAIPIGLATNVSVTITAQP